MDKSPLEPDQAQRRAPTTFFTFPREIRDTIYEHALVSPTPMIAWSGMSIREFHFWQLNKFAWSAPGHLNLREYLSNSDPVRKAAPKIFLSNPIIAHEAAIIFYNKNTFRFVGSWSWDVVVTWLEGIGARNRSSLARLEISMELSHHIWKLEDGDRSLLNPWQDGRLDKVFPRNRFRKPTENIYLDSYNLAENTSPAVEKCMQLLGESDGANLALNMLLDFDNIPGLLIFLGVETPHESWMRVDLADVMEMCREFYTAKKHRDVQIVWNCAATWLKSQKHNGVIYSESWWSKEITFDGKGTVFEQWRKELEDMGWEILEVREESLVHDMAWDGDTNDEYFGYNNDIQDPLSVTRFSMKRKPIVEDAVTDDPSPQS